MSVILLAVALALSACGHTPEERLVSGALIGGLVGATVGVASGPHNRGHGGYSNEYRGDREYGGYRDRDRGHGHRRHGHHDHDYYDDYDDY